MGLYIVTLCSEQIHLGFYVVAWHVKTILTGSYGISNMLMGSKQHKGD